MPTAALATISSPAYGFDLTERHVLPLLVAGRVDGNSLSALLANPKQLLMDNPRAGASSDAVVMTALKELSVRSANATALYTAERIPAAVVGGAANPKTRPMPRREHSPVSISQ